MTKRQKQYRDILAACREQSTGWLERCNAEPGPHQSLVSRLAVRNALRERQVPQWHDISHITEYGLTQRLSSPVRVF